MGATSKQIMKQAQKAQQQGVADELARLRAENEQLRRDNQDLLLKNELLHRHLTAVGSGMMSGYDKQMEELQQQREEARMQVIELKMERDRFHRAYEQKVIEFMTRSHTMYLEKEELKRLTPFEVIEPPYIVQSEEEHKQLIENAEHVIPFDLGNSCKYSLRIGVRYGVEINDYKVWNSVGTFPGTVEEAEHHFKPYMRSIASRAPMPHEIKGTMPYVKLETLHEACLEVALYYEDDVTATLYEQKLDKVFETMIWPEAKRGGNTPNDRKAALQSFKSIVQASFKALAETGRGAKKERRLKPGPKR